MHTLPRKASIATKSTVACGRGAGRWGTTRQRHPGNVGRGEDRGWGGKRKSEPRAGSPHLPDPAPRRSRLCRPLRSAHLSAEDATERGRGLRILRKARCDSEEPRENVINAKRRLHWMV